MRSHNIDPILKTCRKCLQQKPTTEFYKNSSLKDGLHSYCRICHGVYTKRYKQNSQECQAYNRAYSREHYYKHREQHRLEARRWKQDNREYNLSYLRSRNKRYRDQVRRIATELYGELVCGNCGTKILSDMKMYTHHRNPDTKLFGIGDIYVRSDDEIREELEKCTILCGNNCHMAVHRKMNENG